MSPTSGLGHSAVASSSKTSNLNKHSTVAAPTSSASSTTNGSSSGADNPAYTTQLLAAMQAQMMAASMMAAPSPLVSSILGAPYSSSGNVAQPDTYQLIGAMLQQQQSVAAHLNLNNLLSEAVKLSEPIGTCPDDEEIMIEALCESERNSESYRAALDGLHGVNTHAANVWKDYYLEHHRRISQIVAQRCGVSPTKPPGSAKRPKFDDDDDEEEDSSPIRPSKRSRYSDRPDESRHRNREPPTSPKSRTKPKPQMAYRTGRRTPLSPAHTPRCPTPPTEVIPLDPQGLANSWTTADRQYIPKYSRWRLLQNPDLTRDDLARELSEKVPHHNFASWKRHLDRKARELEPIYEEARKAALARKAVEIEVVSDDSDSDSQPDDADDEDEGEEEHYAEDEDDEVEVQGRDGGEDEDDKDQNGVEDEDEDEGEDSDAGDADDTYSEHDAETAEPKQAANGDIATGGDDESDPEEDVRNMSGYRKPFNDADRRVIARHLASLPKSATTKEKWEPFAKMYPQRNAHAWSQMYRTHDAAIEFDVIRYRTRAERQSASGTPLGNGKRAHSEVDSDESGSEEDVPLSKKNRTTGEQGTP